MDVFFLLMLAFVVFAALIMLLAFAQRHGKFVSIFKLETRNSGAERVAKVALTSLPEVRCFKCGKPMEEGFIMIAGRGRWRSAESPPRIFTSAGERLMNLGVEPSLLMVSPGVPENRALRCAECAVVVVDHSKLLVINE